MKENGFQDGYRAGYDQAVRDTEDAWKRQLDRIITTIEHEREQIDVTSPLRGRQ